MAIETGKPTLKAWRINEYEAWSGATLDEALEAQMAVTGCTRDEALDETYAYELARSLVLKGDDGDPDTTVGAVLDSMTEPGFVCGWGD